LIPTLAVVSCALMNDVRVVTACSTHTQPNELTVQKEQFASRVTNGIEVPPLMSSK
jgi:hypothetical protein